MALHEFSQGMNYVAGREVVNEQNEEQILEEFWDAFASWFNSLDKPREDLVSRTVIDFKGVKYPLYVYYGEVGQFDTFILETDKVKRRYKINRSNDD